MKILVLTLGSALVLATTCLASDNHESDKGIEGTLRAVLPDKDVHVHVHDGIVKLDGRVRTEMDRERIDSLVRNTTGVVAVKDDLRVTSASPGAIGAYPLAMPAPVPVYTTAPPEVAPPAAIVTTPASPLIIPDYPKIKVQAWTSADEPSAHRLARRLRDDSVPSNAFEDMTITVRNGNVSLRGFVNSQHDHDLLLASLQRVGGITAIYDELRIR